MAEDDFITSAQDTCFDNGDDFSITFLDFSIISCLSTQGTRNKEQGTRRSMGKKEKRAWGQRAWGKVQGRRKSKGNEEQEQ